MYGGVEAGGTKFVCAVGSTSYDLSTPHRIDTGSPDETLGKVIAYFQTHPSRRSLRAIGIGSFGPLDPDLHSPTYGSILPTTKPGWGGTNLVVHLAQALQLPIFLDTDVNAAALGEYRWGAGQGLDSLLYLTVGTGIGGGGLLAGRRMHGLLHPEMGHIRVPHDWARDPFPGICDFHGDCLEGLASGPALAARWNRPADALPQDHPAWVLEADYLGLAVANLVLTLSPQRIILGGGVMRQRSLYPLVRACVRLVLNGYVQARAVAEGLDEYIVPPALGDHSGVLGAIALAEQAERGG